METTAYPNRIWFLDRLRICCIFFVMLLHVAAAFWNFVPVSGAAFAILNAYNGLAHFCVPCLVMISGALLLDPARDGSIAGVWKKRLPRIALALLFWTAAYALVRTAWKLFSARPDAGTLGAYALNCLKEPAHLWYLYMLIGLYLVLPLLRAVTADRNRTRYFLLLSLVFAFLLPELKRFVPICSDIAFLLEDRYIPFVLGYTGYFVLGRYLYETTLTKRRRFYVFVLGAVGLFAATVGTLLLSRARGAAFPGFHEYLCVPQLLLSAGVFTLFQYRLNRPPQIKNERLLVRLSENSFGMYLVHLFFSEAFIAFGVTAISFAPLVSVPLLSAAIFLLSYAAAVLIRRVPFVKRYLT